MSESELSYDGEVNVGNTFSLPVQLVNNFNIENIAEEMVEQYESGPLLEFIFSILAYAGDPEEGVVPGSPLAELLYLKLGEALATLPGVPAVVDEAELPVRVNVSLLDGMIESLTEMTKRLADAVPCNGYDCTVDHSCKDR